MRIEEDKPFQGQVHGDNLYQTWTPPPPLSHWVHYFWQLKVPKGEFQYLSVPDNCVDLIINLDNLNDAFLISPFLTPIVYPLQGPTTYFGVRFRLLGQHILLSEPISEWGPDDHQMPIKDLFSDSIISQFQATLAVNEPFETRSLRFAKALIHRMERPVVDPRIVKFLRYCYSTNNGLSMAQLATQELGLGERQLRRLSHQYLGVSPKAFCKVLRFQHTLRAWQTQQDQMAWADWYFDQSHFSREFKQLASVTPGQFLKMSVLYNRPASQSSIILLNDESSK